LILSAVSYSRSVCVHGLTEEMGNAVTRPTGQCTSTSVRR